MMRLAPRTRQDSPWISPLSQSAGAPVEFRSDSWPAFDRQKMSIGRGASRS